MIATRSTAINIIARPLVRKAIGTAALLASVGCGSPGPGSSGVVIPTHPQTNISSSQGIVFKAGLLYRYESGNIHSAILAADTPPLQGYIFKAHTSIYFHENGKIQSGTPANTNLPFKPTLTRIYFDEDGNETSIIINLEEDTPYQGFIFKESHPLVIIPGKLISGVLAADISIQGFTIKAGSEVVLDQDGQINSAKLDQEIKIPIAPIIKEIQDSIFGSMIFDYKIYVSKNDSQKRMSIKEIIEIINSQGGTLTIPGESLMIYFDEDGQLDEVELRKDLPINPQLKILISGLKVDIPDNLTSIFPKSYQTIKSSSK